MVKDAPAPRAIVFDWDNTLVDSWDAIIAAMNRTLRTMGHAEWEPAEARRRIARSLRDSFPQLFGERWREARAAYYAAFEAVHLETLRPLPGVAAMLEGLRALGIRLAVVSNKDGRLLRREAAHLGWNDLFDRLVGANDAEADKPAAAPVRLALDGSGIAAGDAVWLVGDAGVDMECAYNAGCVPVLLRPEEPAPGEFAHWPPHRHVRDGHALFALARGFFDPISTESRHGPVSA